MKIWTVALFLANPKNRNCKNPDLEIFLLFDPGDDSNIINIKTWNEVHSLHPSFTLLNILRKIANKSYKLTKFGKVQLYL